MPPFLFVGRMAGRAAAVVVALSMQGGRLAVTDEPFSRPQPANLHAVQEGETPPGGSTPISTVSGLTAVEKSATPQNPTTASADTRADSAVSRLLHCIALATDCIELGSLRTRLSREVARAGSTAGPGLLRALEDTGTFARGDDETLAVVLQSVAHLDAATVEMTLFADDDFPTNH